MRLRSSVEGYGALSQMMHWITVVLVILAWLLGQFDDVFPKGAARAAGLFVHISAGLAVIGILVLRLFWGFADRPPLRHGHAVDGHQRRRRTGTAVARAFPARGAGAGTVCAAVADAGAAAAPLVIAV